MTGDEKGTATCHRYPREAMLSRRKAARSRRIFHRRCSPTRMAASVRFWR